jgi:hypothetical protein
MEVKKIPGELYARGWYLPPDIPFPVALEAYASLKKDREELDQYMMEIMDHDLSFIEKDIAERFPKREQILRDAFDAYREGKHSLAIPVFLAQADGMFCDLTGMNATALSAGKNKIERKSEYVQKCITVQNLGDAFVFAPLTNETPLTQYYPPDQDPAFFNRHAVLHGLDTEYASKINSLKAISYLFFVARCPMRPDEEQP